MSNVENINEEDFKRLKDEVIKLKEKSELKLDGLALATLFMGLAGFIAVSETQTIVAILIGLCVWAASLGRKYSFDKNNRYKYRGTYLRRIGFILIVINIAWYFIPMYYKSQTIDFIRQIFT